MNFDQKLKQIAWDQLHHSYGTAEDVPGMLRDLKSPDKKTRDNARSGLLHSLDHQGVQRWESTAKAVPFLLDLLQDTSVPDRHLLLPLLTDFAVGYANGIYLYSGFHIDEVCRPEGTKEYGYYVFGERQGSPEDTAYGRLMRSIYEEVRKGLPIYLQLAQDKNLRMRVFAAQTLGWLTDAAAEIVPVLTAILATEKRGTARASQALALAYVTTFDAALREQCRPALAAAFDKATAGFEQRMVGIALLRVGGRSEPADAVLFDALRHPPAKLISHREFPWAPLEESSVLCGLLLRYAPRLEQIAEAVCDGIRQLKDEHDVLDLATNLLTHFFPMPDQAPMGYDSYRPFALEDFNELQRLILRTLVETPLVWHFGNMQLLLNDHGLPVYQDRLRKFLDGEGDVMRYRYRETHLMPTDFFEKLNAVAWRDYAHHFGKADDIPDMLRALLAPEAEQRCSARLKLTESLIRGNDASAVSLLVIPLLLEMLPHAPEPHLLLALLADIAVDGAQNPRHWGYQTEYYYFVHGFQTTSKTVGRGYEVSEEARLLAEQIYAEVRKSVPYLLTLVDHSDAMMRRYAAFALGWFSPDAAQINPALLKRFQQETDPLTRLSLALALAYVSMFNPELQTVWRSAVEAALSGAETPLERRILAMALLRGGHKTDTVKKALLTALAQSDSAWSDFEQFPWARLEDNNVLLDFMLHLTPENWQPDIVEAACAYLKGCDQANEKDRAEDAAESLLRYCFVELDTQARFGAGEGKNAATIKLNPIQRRVLQTIVELDLFWDEDGYPHLPLLGYGVPGYRKEVRKALKK